MAFRLGLCILTGACAAASVSAWVQAPSVISPVDVPEWFRGPAGDRYTAYSVWKSLGTPDAMCAVGPRWGAVGGVLQGDDDKAIPNCPLRVESDGEYGRQFSVWLQTDAEGRFVLYGVENGPSIDAPPAGDPGRGGRRMIDQCRCGGFQVRAAPGYPATSLGRKFADEDGGWRDCRITGVSALSDQRTFFVATCSDRSSFRADSFAEFRMRAGRDAAPKQAPFRGRPRRELKEGRGVVNRYGVRVVDDAGEPVAGALIYYMAYDGFEGNQQTVKSDADGFAELEEHLLTGRGPDYEGRLIRRLAIDVEDGAVGPSDPRLSPGVPNVIRVSAAATVRGKIVDRNGEPFADRTEVSLRYARDSLGLSFELRAAVAPDGTFEFDRVMPREPFRVVASPRISAHASPCHWGLTPLLEGVSDEMTLGPGEVREDVRVAVRPAAPLRGVVLDEDGREVAGSVTIEYSRPAYGPDKWTSWDRIGEDGPRHGTKPDPTRPRFGDVGLDLLPVKFRVKAPGYREEIAGPFEPKPGELTFIRIILRPES